MSICYSSTNPSSSPIQHRCSYSCCAFLQGIAQDLIPAHIPTFLSGISTAVRVPEGSVVASQP